MSALRLTAEQSSVYTAAVYRASWDRRGNGTTCSCLRSRRGLHVKNEMGRARSAITYWDKRGNHWVHVSRWSGSWTTAAVMLYGSSLSHFVDVHRETEGRRCRYELFVPQRSNRQSLGTLVEHKDVSPIICKLVVNDSSCEAGMHHFQADLTLTSHSRVLLIQIHIWQDSLWAYIKWIRTPLGHSETIGKWEMALSKDKVSFVEWLELCRVWREHVDHGSVSREGNHVYEPL